MEVTLEPIFKWQSADPAIINMGGKYNQTYLKLKQHNLVCYYLHLLICFFFSLTLSLGINGR